MSGEAGGVIHFSLAAFPAPNERGTKSARSWPPSASAGSRFRKCACASLGELDEPLRPQVIESDLAEAGVAAWVFEHDDAGPHAPSSVRMSCVMPTSIASRCSVMPVLRDKSPKLCRSNRALTMRPPAASPKTNAGSSPRTGLPLARTRMPNRCPLGSSARSIGLPSGYFWPTKRYSSPDGRRQALPPFARRRRSKGHARWCRDRRRACRIPSSCAVDLATTLSHAMPRSRGSCHASPACGPVATKAYARP
jgi:hypothetical protein